MKDTLQKRKKRNYSTNSGIVIVEILVACTIIITSGFAVMSLAQKSVQFSYLALSQVQASFLLEEGAEAVRSIRDNSNGWTTITSLTPNTNYYLVFSNNAWSFSPTNTYPTDNFTRTVSVSPVSRNISDDISATGTDDPGTKKVTITVSWPYASATTTKTLSFYVANILN